MDNISCTYCQAAITTSHIRCAVCKSLDLCLQVCFITLQQFRSIFVLKYIYVCIFTICVPLFLYISNIYVGDNTRFLYWLATSFVVFQCFACGVELGTHKKDHDFKISVSLLLSEKLFYHVLLLCHHLPFGFRTLDSLKCLEGMMIGLQKKMNYSWKLSSSLDLEAGKQI